MNLIFKSIRYYCLILLLLCASIICAKTSHSPIVIISSYNPADRQTSTTISNFMDELKSLGCERSIVIENMNCKSFFESREWKSNMLHILNKYSGNEKPGLIILLGQEAFVSYLSLDKEQVKNVPIMCSLVSRNIVLLPDSTVNTTEYLPLSIDLFDNQLCHEMIKSGFIYEYDIKANIDLILSLYPNTKHIAFISDNTYGGVTMQALVRKEIINYPQLDLILLDGRKNTIYTVVEQLKSLPANTAILVGTWRIDKNEGYFMRNATYSMMEANPKLPAFAPASVSLGHWAIGGVTPNYRRLGKDIAHEVIRIINNPEADVNIEIITNQTVIDYNRMNDYNIDINNLPLGVNVQNRPLTFYEENKGVIWLVLIILTGLGFGLLISLFFYFRTKRLKDQLEISESNLREAKNNAEESNRLKSAFLANMSHEIRTPLNAIVGFADVLTVEDVSKAEMSECNEIIKTNADLLLRLINDILDLSRLESGRVKLEYESCDVIRLCHHVLATVASTRNSGNKFVFESQYDSFHLNTDTQRLQQVIINLLSNAAKFTNNGVITLGFDVDETEQNVVFSVTDTGCGIPNEKQNMVFERFEKLNEYAQGTGLGLSICKLITQKWNGRIWIDSSYKNGARFMFTHPLNK